MKASIYSLLLMLFLISCDLQITVSPTTPESIEGEYRGLAICDNFITLDSTLQIVLIDRTFDEVEVDLGDGLTFEGEIDEDGVIVLDSDTEIRMSNGTSLRLTNGLLFPTFTNDLDFTFDIRENNGTRGSCRIELERT